VSTSSASVTLAHGGVFPRQKVHFAFPSGSLTFDCVSCGSQCCRGHGFVLGSTEEPSSSLLNGAALRFFVGPSQKSRGASLVRNCPPACFFLSPSGLCRIHADEGFDRKPETCRLFPFNSFIVVGETLLVLPHPTLCPLQASLRSQPSALSDHDRLFDVMSGQTLSTSFQGSAPSQDFLPLERAVQILAAATLAGEEDHSQFFTAHGQLNSTFLSNSDQPEPSASMYDRLGSMAAEILGTWPSIGSLSDPLLSRLLVASTPSIRARLLFSPTSDKSGPAAFRVPLDILPEFVYLLHKVMALARDAGMGTINYQTVSRLAADHGALLAFMSYLDRRVAICRSRPIDLRPFGSNEDYSRFLTLVRTLHRVSTDSAVVLGEVICQVLRGRRDGRVQWLSSVATRLAARLEPLPRRTKWRFGRLALGAAVQRLMVGTLDDKLVSVLTEGRKGL
jgi:hypothetical protein